MTTLYIRITRKEASFNCGGQAGAAPHDGTFAGIVAVIKKIEEAAGYFDVTSLTIEDV